MGNMTLFVFALVLAYFPNFLHAIGDIPTHDFIEREIYCHGCEYTIKALDRLITEEPYSEEEKLDERVSSALETVCSEEHFEGSPHPEKYVTACNFLKEENGQILEPVLVSHYSGKHGGSFLDLSHQVCLGLSKACEAVPGEKRYPDHLDADLEYDKEDNTFRVKPGRKMRVPKPMRAKEDL